MHHHEVSLFEFFWFGLYSNMDLQSLGRWNKPQSMFWMIIPVKVMACSKYSYNDSQVSEKLPCEEYTRESRLPREFWLICGEYIGDQGASIYLVPASKPVYKKLLVIQQESRLHCVFFLLGMSLDSLENWHQQVFLWTNFGLHLGKFITGESRLPSDEHVRESIRIRITPRTFERIQNPF
jgi:hypothetical protein